MLCACTCTHPHLVPKSNKHPEHSNRPKDHPQGFSARSLPRALGSTVKQCCVLGDITIVTASHFSQTNLCPILCLLHECWCSGLANFRSFSAPPKLSEGKVCGFFSCHSLLVPWPQSDSNDKFSPTHNLNPTAQGWRSASPTISNAKSEIRH